jgi:O-antigen biosynthesis protein
MSVLAAMWKSFRHEFLPAARRARVKRSLPKPKSLLGRVKTLYHLWRDLIVRRRWICCDHPPFHADEPPQLSGIIELQGWAVAVDGIESVSISCNGSPFGQASLGVRRPELTRRFPHISRVARNGFYLALDTRALPDGLHELTLTARTGRGRTFHLSGPLRVANRVRSYERWRLQTTPNAAAIAWMRRNISHLPFRPTVALVVPVRTQPDVAGLARTLDTVISQVYPHWQLVIACEVRLCSDVAQLVQHQPDDRVQILADDFENETVAFNAGMQHASGELWAPLDAGAELVKETLFEVVYHFNRWPDTDLVYTDEEVDGYPVFKPNWSPRFLLGVNYVGRLWIARRHLVDDANGYDASFGSAAEYDLLLRLTERARSVGHVPKVLVQGQRFRSSEDSASAVRAALERRGIDAETTAGPVAGTVRIRRRLPASRRLVSILIEGTNATARRLLESLSLRTSYHDHELRLVGAPGPGFAERLNKAADAARGEYLLFVRADAVLADDWVEALLDEADCPEVGVVGGHLQDATGRTVDAGLALAEDDRLLIPVSKSMEPDDPGTLPFLGVSRDCSAVSRDCLMVRRELFLELGGFDERLDGRLIEADFCLHARAKGYAVVSTPHSCLRVASEPPSEPSAAAVETYRSRWGSSHERGDPFHSKNFSRRRDGFRIIDEPTLLTHAPVPLIDRESVRRILAIKPDHVGDVLLALPAVRRLRDLFPEAELTMLVGPHTRSLVEREPAVDRVLTYEYFFGDSHRAPKKLTEAERADLRAWLAGFHFDLAVDLRRETDSRELSRLSAARWTAGFADPGEAEWLTVVLPCEGAIRLLRPGRHMSQDLVRLVDMIDRAMTAPAPRPEIEPGPEDEEIARLFAETVPREHRLLIGIHPGSGRPIKCWPAAYFGRLAGLFAERLGAAVVVFGGPGEEKIAAEVIENAPPSAPIVSLAGRFGLSALSAAIRRCDLFVGNDSGPTHLAATTGIPVLGVFAGTADPLQWGPLGPGAASIQRALLCAPCYVSRPRDCPLGVTCTRYLHPEPVFEAAVRVLLPRWHRLKMWPSNGRHTIAQEELRKELRETT